MKATIQRLERRLVEMDTGLLRPKGYEVPQVPEITEVHHVEDSLTDLQREITKLRSELEDLK